MTSALQNRLVGTIIIVALAVIFLPDLLDGEKQTSQDLFDSIPEQPIMRDVKDAEDFPVEQVKQDVSRKVEIVPDVATDDFEINQDEDNVNLSTDVASHSEDNNVENPQDNNSADIDRAIEDKVDVNTVANGDRLLAQAGWVIQLGVFRHQKNVSELLSQLRNAGYQAFSRPVQTSTGELTKVFVGPELQKEKLQKAVPHLRELTKLQGRVTPFTVK